MIVTPDLAMNIAFATLAASHQYLFCFSSWTYSVEFLAHWVNFLD